MGIAPRNLPRSGFSVNGGTALRSDRRSGETVYVESLNVNSNKQLPTISIDVMGNSKTEYRPFIIVETQEITGTWLYNTGASVSCMSVTQFRRIAIENRPP